MILTIAWSTDFCGGPGRDTNIQGEVSAAPAQRQAWGGSRQRQASV